MHDPFRSQFLESFRIGRVFIHGDDSRSAGMGLSKRSREEVFGRLSISCGAEEKFQGVPLKIHGAIEINSDLLHFDISLIDSPRVIRLFDIESAALL